MKYFLHDSNAFQDEKITELFMKFGYEGLGLFYTALEKFAAQEKPIKTDVLKAQLKVGKKLEKCWKFMESLGILSSNNGETFNKQLLNYSQKYQIKKEKNKERVSQWRENQKNIESVTHYEQVRNTPKVNKSKVKESKRKVVTSPTLFRDSLNFEIEIFESSFAGTDYENFNLKYYHEKVLNWSDSKQAKKIDWIATARNFMLGDVQDQKAVYKGVNLTNNGKQTDANGRTILNADSKQRLANEMEEYYRKNGGQPNSGD